MRRQLFAELITDKLRIGISGFKLRSRRTITVKIPAGTPADVVSRLNTATSRILAQPAIRERIAAQGLEAVGGSSEAFAKLYADDYEKYGRLVKELGITVN